MPERTGAKLRAGRVLTGQALRRRFGCKTSALNETVTGNSRRSATSARTRMFLANLAQKNPGVSAGADLNASPIV
jgi:hypothetical protein